MQQIKLQFNTIKPDGTPWWGHEVRDLVARKLDGVPGVHRLMNYTEEGKPDPVAYPFVRFRGGIRAFSIVGIGQQGVDLVSEFIPHFVHLTEEPVPINLMHPELAYTPTEFAMSYTAHQLVPGVKTWQRDMLRNDRAESLRWLSDVMQRGLRRQCEALNMIPGDLESLQVHDYTLFAPIRTDKAGKAFASQVRAEFTLHAKLAGDWAAGRHMGRGYGRITRAKRAADAGIRQKKVA